MSKYEQLENYLKEKPIRVIPKDLVVEYETEKDYCQFAFWFDAKRNLFICSVSIYHISRDNNCENQEAHTVEETYRNQSLDELIEEVKKANYDSFEEEFEKVLQGVK